MNAEENGARYNFRAMQAGHCFHGFCTRVKNEEQRITFIGRNLTRYSFEPGETSPRAETIPLGQLTLLKTDFHVVVTVAPTL